MDWKDLFWPKKETVTMSLVPWIIWNLVYSVGFLWLGCRELTVNGRAVFGPLDIGCFFGRLAVSLAVSLVVFYGLSSLLYNLNILGGRDEKWSVTKVFLLVGIGFVEFLLAVFVFFLLFFR